MSTTPSRAPPHITARLVQRQPAVEHQQAEGRERAGDEHVDHRVVDPLHHPHGTGRPGEHVVHAAGEVEQHRGRAVHPGRGVGQAAVGDPQEQHEAEDRRHARPRGAGGRAAWVARSPMDVDAHRAPRIPVTPHRTVEPRRSWIAPLGSSPDGAAADPPRTAGAGGEHRRPGRPRARRGRPDPGRGARPLARAGRADRPGVESDAAGHRDGPTAGRGDRPRRARSSTVWPRWTATPATTCRWRSSRARTTPAGPR